MNEGLCNDCGQYIGPCRCPRAPVPKGHVLVTMDAWKEAMGAGLERDKWKFQFTDMRQLRDRERKVKETWMDEFDRVVEELSLFRWKVKFALIVAGSCSLVWGIRDCVASIIH